MKKMTLALVATTALTLSAGAAAAQQGGWMPISQRMERLDDRIDAGVRNGDLTRSEAVRLRTAFSAVANLESHYRVNGLSAWERSDLDRRYDALAMRIRAERRDSQERDYTRGDRDGRDYGRGEGDGRDYARDGRDRGDWYGGRNWTDQRGQWVSIERRKEQLDRRIDQGVRSGQLTRPEAAALRAEFNNILRVERAYSNKGISTTERAGLDSRFDKLAAKIRAQRSDSERTYGRNDYQRR